VAAHNHGPAQTVVVLGGGIGGVAAANRLRRRLDRRHRVILINRDPDFTFAASYLWVMSGRRRPNQVTRPLQSLQRRGIEVVIADVEAIDPVTRTVTAGGRQIAADHLIVSLGADYATDKIPGLQRAGETFATLTGALRLAPAVNAVTKGRVLVVTTAPLYRCPAAPYEAALLIDAALRHRGVRGNVDVAVHSAEPAPMGVAGANVSAAVTAILDNRGIDYHPSHQITAAEPGRADFADGRSEGFDLLVYMPPIRLPDVVAASALASTSGWIEADRQTLATVFPGVYAIGDNTHLPLSIGKPLPRAGVFAHAQALVVADNVAATIQGASATARFDGHGGCYIETGFGKAGYGSGDFYAEPSPKVNVRRPARRWHLGKVAFEYNVMRRWL
jgi:sulfide:quinone oxidoreductase